MTIKELQPKDIEAFDGLFETLNHLSPSPEMSAQQTVEYLKMMNQRDIHVFVAIEDKKIIGTTSILIEPKMIRGGVLAAHIEEVAVHTNHQGKGIASKLIQTALKYADTRKCYKVSLTCDDDLEGFYNKNTFHRNGIIMRKDLSQHL